MKNIKYIAYTAALFLMASCQNKDIDIAAPILEPIPVESIKGELVGDDLIISWPSMPGKSMNIQVRNEYSMILNETVDGNTYTHTYLDTNVPYTYVLKVTDGTNFSSGVLYYYTRPGATKISGLTMAQLDNADGSYSAKVTWDAPVDAENILFSATSGEKKVTESLPANTTEFIIPNVIYGEVWDVVVTAQNSAGNSLPTSSSLLIGKTTIGFLSVYATSEELVTKGDDDEASAWLWLHEEYPSAQFVYFGDISSSEDISNYRVLFWLRDLEGVGEEEVFTMPEVVEQATPYIRDWYAEGGSLLLWSHATVYVGTLGRLEASMLKNNDKAIGAGEGGINNDTWKMAVELNPGGKFKKDASSHPIYRGLAVETTETTKLIPFKGPGWTEDHNCLFFNIPAVLTGKNNQEEDCYNILVNTYGIIPLGTWDSQIDFVSQLNVWEAQKGNTEFNGTILCIGNGGCEFSMKNEDGSKDVSAHPKNNIYQDNVLTLAKNSLEYLKTR